MTDTPKPRARKPAKRGPTKAAALKALGLTSEEFDALKSAARELTEIKAQKAKAEELKSAVKELGLIKSKVVEASASLRPGPGFGAAPSDPQQELESRPQPALASQPQAVQQAIEEPVWYMRNLRHTEVGFRLSRQADSSKKRTNLKPRGQRGDIVKLEPGDLKDSELQTQVAYQLIEIIPEGEALEAIRKQYTNHQGQVPAHIAMLRNPKGEEYAQTNPVKMATNEEAFGVKVADLDPGLMQGKLSDKEIKRDGGIVQPDMMQPVQNPSPGNIINDGFMAPAQQGLGNAASDNERAAQVDALVRSKQFEGPDAGLGEVTVKVAPVQRS